MRTTLGEVRRLVRQSLHEGVPRPEFNHEAPEALELLRRWYASDYPTTEELQELAEDFPYEGLAYRITWDADSVDPPCSWSADLSGLRRYLSLRGDIGERMVVLRADISGWSIADYAVSARSNAKKTNAAVDQIIAVKEVVALIRPTDVDVIGYVDEDGVMTLDEKS